MTLVAGPVTLPTPSGVTRIDVETARQMADAVQAALPADAAVMVAAVADDTARLEALLGRDFGWTRTWDAQRAQCARDGVCRVSLIPPKARRR